MLKRIQISFLMYFDPNQISLFFSLKSVNKINRYSKIEIKEL